MGTIVKVKPFVVKYFDLTESFAQTVCTGEPTKYGATPGTKEELLEVLEFKKDTLKDLLSEAKAQGISEEAFRKEMRRYVESGEFEMDRSIF